MSFEGPNAGREVADRAAKHAGGLVSSRVRTRSFSPALPEIEELDRTSGLESGVKAGSPTNPFEGL